MHQCEGDDQREQREQHRFADELPNQLDTLGAQDLPDPDLLRPAGGAGGGQVHEIHAGDDEYEDGQGREDIDIADVAVGPQLGFDVGMQVDLRERLQVGVGFYARGLERFAEVLVQERAEPGFHFLARGAFPEQQIGIQIVVEPAVLNVVRIAVVELIRRQRGEGSQEVEMEVGSPRHVPHDARHGELVEVVPRDHLPDGVFVSEVLAGHGLGQHHGMRFDQGGPGVALYERDGEDVEDRRVRENEVPLVEPVLLIPDEPAGSRRLDPGVALDFRVVPRKDGRPGRGRDGRFDRSVRNRGGFRNAVDTVFFLMMLVVGEFVLHVEQDQHAARHADGQPEDVDGRIALVPAQVSQGDGQVVPDHVLIVLP